MSGQKRTRSKRVEVREDSRRVAKAAAAIEATLIKYRRGGYGVDLAEDPEDPTKADSTLALAVMKLLKKYGDQLVLARYRGRVTISWRDSTFAAVSDDHRERGINSGFFVGADATLEELRTGSDPSEVGHPGDPDVQKRIGEKRRARVQEWIKSGWKGDPGWAAEGGDPETVARLTAAAKEGAARAEADAQALVSGEAIVAPNGVTVQLTDKASS